MNFHVRSFCLSAAIAAATITLPARAADVDEPMSFDISAQPLDEALLEFGTQSGIQVVSSAASLANKATQGVRGVLSPRSALTQLLRGSSVSFVVSGPNSVSIKNESADESADVADPPTAEDAAGESAALSFAGGLEEVVITASRVNRDGFDAPTPTTVVSGADLGKTGATNIADMLNRQVPSFTPDLTPAASTLSTGGGGNYLNLRGLGGSRTLVLVDGLRHVPTNATAGVNLNVIPAALIDRVEIVTGGASAAWGSDAVAGVVNLVFKKDFEGLQSEVQFGQSERGDNEEYRASAAYGTSFAADRGHFMIGAEFARSHGILDQSQRSWGTQDWQLIANPAFAPGNGQPARLIASDVHLAFATEGGLILGPGALSGIQFAPGGVPIPFVSGSPVSPPSQVGGDGINPGRYSTLLPPLERKSVFARSTFAFNDDLTGFLELSYAESQTGHEIAPSFDFGSIVISQENAYLDPSLRAQMSSLGIPAFVMGRYNTDFGFIRTDNQTDTSRVALGLDGVIGGDWTWQTYYQYGRTGGTNRLFNERLTSAYASAIDAVVDPGSGQIVCRSTLTNPGNGCVPINLFGFGSPSAAALDYIRGVSEYRSRITQHAAAFSLQGEAFSTWAGPVSVATGAEYREETVDVEVDSLSASGAFFLGNALPLAGSLDVKEVFVEAVAPLSSAASALGSLDLNAAARLTDYSTSGDVTTWKLGLTYKPADSLLLRATRSRDIRAPNIAELFATRNESFATPIDPATGLQRLITVIAGGNPNLTAEEADTVTAGLVYSPAWLAGFQASIDAYEIELSDAISFLNTQAVINRCFAGAANLCSFVERDAAGNLASVTLSAVNVSELKSRGVDVEFRYSTPMSRFAAGWAGDLSLRLLGSYVDELTTSDGVTAKDTAGSLGSDVDGIPRWRMTTSVSYDRGPLSFYLGSRFISAGKYDKDFGEFDIDNNEIPSRLYFDTSLRYAFFQEGSDHQLEIVGVVSNLFDRDPPVNPTKDFIATPTNRVYYDVIGRMFSVALRFSY